MTGQGSNLSKIHKKNTPLRPIVSFVSSPLYNLTKYISNVLQNSFIKDDKYVKNLFQFSNFIRNQTIPDDYQIISLDVVLLFTNIFYYK